MRETWGMDRSVPKTDFGAGCMTVCTYKNISSYSLQRSELMDVNYISLKCFKKWGETGSGLDLAHKPCFADP